MVVKFYEYLITYKCVIYEFTQKGIHNQTIYLRPIAIKSYLNVVFPINNYLNVPILNSCFKAFLLAEKNIK